MKQYKKPEATKIEFAILEDIAYIPGMDGGVTESGGDLEDEE